VFDIVDLLQNIP